MERRPYSITVIPQRSIREEHVNGGSAGRVVIMGQIFPLAYFGNDSISAFAYLSQAWKWESKKKKKISMWKAHGNNYKNKSEAKARINPFTGRQAEVNAGDDIIVGCGNCACFDVG